MKKGILLLLLVSAASFCHAQDELPTVVPDRPGFVWGAEVTPIHKVAWDNGFSFESMPDGTRSITLNSTSLRYGIFESLGAFIETINYLHREEQSQHLTEIGLTWLVSRRVQLDIEADLDFRNFGKYYGISAGVALLIN